MEILIPICLPRHILFIQIRPSSTFSMESETSRMEFTDRMTQIDAMSVGVLQDGATTCLRSRERDGWMAQDRSDSRGPWSRPMCSNGRLPADMMVMITISSWFETICYTNSTHTISNTALTTNDVHVCFIWEQLVGKINGKIDPKYWFGLKDKCLRWNNKALVCI